MSFLDWLVGKPTQRMRAQARIAKINRVRQHQTRLLTVAFRQLHLASDFRRLASWGWQCQAVPLRIRQALYQRNRGVILRFLNRQIRAGVCEELLENSLTDLLQSLGIAPFEAEYLWQHIRRVRPERRQTETDQNFQHQLERLQRDHQQRLEALQSIENSDLREQLLETEEQRFRQHLLDWTERSND